MSGWYGLQGWPGRSGWGRLEDGECRRTEPLGKQEGRLGLFGHVWKARPVLGIARTRGGEAGWLCEAQVDLELVNGLGFLKIGEGSEMKKERQRKRRRGKDVRGERGRGGGW